MWERLFKKAENLKLILSTGGLLVATLIGGYNIGTMFFVSTAYAEELENRYNSKLNQLQEQTLSNSMMIIEMQLIRLETKMARGETLTPTELRQYEKLKEKLK